MKIFTGQKILYTKENYDYVKCKKCKEPVSMKLAYFDEYNKQSYVHKECLSTKRKQEIENVETTM